MSVLQEAKELLSVMTPAEKAQMLQWIVQAVGNKAYNPPKTNERLMSHLLHDELILWTPLTATPYPNDSSPVVRFGKRKW